MDSPISLKLETIIDSLFAFSSPCILRIPLFSSALMTWFSFLIRTAFILKERKSERERRREWKGQRREGRDGSTSRSRFGGEERERERERERKEGCRVKRYLPDVPRTTHHVTGGLKLLDLIRSKSDLSSSRDSLTVGDEGGHGGTLSWSEVASEAG